jgi:hypothetical protein
MLNENNMVLPSNLADSLLEDLTCVYLNAWLGQMKIVPSESVFSSAETYAKIKMLEILKELEINGFEWSLVQSK